LLTYFFSRFLWFQEQSLSLCHCQKDPGYGKKFGIRKKIRDTEKNSGYGKKFIPDPGGKTALDWIRNSGTMDGDVSSVFSQKMKSVRI
jgi:hypothetical protein